jgi:meiotic recombination protein SPO11
MLCLVDADPYGVDIFLTYKFGSRTSAAEPDCTVASMVWIGIDLAFLRDQQIDETFLLDMNERDLQKAKSLAARDCLKNQEAELRYGSL